MYTKNQENSSKTRVEIRVRLEQRMKDPATGLSYFGIMQSISDALNVMLNTTRHNDGVEYYVVASTSPKKLITLVNYLTTFPLFTSK